MHTVISFPYLLVMIHTSHPPHELHISQREIYYQLPPSHHAGERLETLIEDHLHHRQTALGPDLPPHITYKRSVSMDCQVNNLSRSKGLPLQGGKTAYSVDDCSSAAVSACTCSQVRRGYYSGAAHSSAEDFSSRR